MQPKILFHIAIALLLFISNSMHGQINHKVSFPKNFSINPEELDDGNIYNRIEFNDMLHADSIGYPSLPVKYINLLVPPESEITGLTINHAQGNTINLDYLIEPAQNPKFPVLINLQEDFIGPNKKKYNSNTPYPSASAAIVKENLFRGNKIVTLAVYPFRYFPASNQLEFYASVDFTLNYTGSGENNKQDRVKIDENSLTGKVLKYLIDNKEDIGKYGIQCQNKKSTHSGNDISTKSLKSAQTTSSITIDADYVIVTSEELAPSFNDFMNWKKRKGIDIKLVTIEDIYNNYSGDLISGINDNAGKLRQFLFDAYDNGNGIDYALLGGDNSVLPIRHGCSWFYVPMDSMFIVPTDLYFSEFDGDWDDDSDAYYGEPISPSGGDAVDYFQEIFIGRIMVTSASEVRNWTNKVETYELNPGNGDPSYVTKAFFTQADQMQVDNQARDILNNATWITDTTIFEEEGGGCTYTVPDFPTGSDVIDEFNNHYGFCSFMTHGRPCAIGVASLFFNSADSCNEHALAVQCANNSKYKVTAFDNGVSGCGTISENGNGFDNMTNYYHPSIYYSVSCTTMPFDDYKYVSSASERNMGESFTCISEGGGPVYLGNTRPGLTDHSFYLFGKFIDAIVDSNFFNVGITESASKDLFNYSGIHNYITFSHNLLGCPETEIWTAVPSTFSSASVTKNGSSVTVNTGGVSGATICVMSALDNGNSYYDMHTGTSHTFTNVPELYYATIDKHNKIPYTRNPTSVLIQNETLNSYGYLSCQTVSAGYSVDPNKTYGNVLIEDGASITFDATGDILLDNGFEVELGATFEAK